tara:strand:- start:756 stop:1601 length:846 start_codon:yes stop_codon:yes gene_type:complete
MSAHRHHGEVVYTASCRTHCGLTRSVAEKIARKEWTFPARAKRSNILIAARSTLLKRGTHYIWVSASDIDIGLFACNNGTVGSSEAYGAATQVGEVVCEGRDARVSIQCRAPANYIEKGSTVQPRHVHLVDRDDPKADVLTVVVLPYFLSQSGESEVRTQPIINGHERSSIFIHHGILAHTVADCANDLIVRIRAESADPRAMPAGEHVLAVHPTRCHDIKGEIRKAFPRTTYGTPVAIYYDLRSRADAYAIAALLWKEGMQRWILCQCDIEPAVVCCSVS